MVGSTRSLLALTVLAAALAAARAHAQTAAPAAPALPGPAAAPEPEFLQGFPRPPAVPASLMAPAPPVGPPPPDPERPYFQPDPLLDPPPLGLPGWFGDVDIGILKPHLVNQLTLPVTFPDGSTTKVGVDASHLDWTVSPRVEVGYRLPSGFGGIAVSYRFLSSQGSDAVIGADGPATLHSRLDYHIGDVDWVSNEYTPWHVCDMRVRFGLRYFNSYFDSQATEPFAEAAAGTTIFQQRTTDHVWVLGPHAGVDLRRRLDFWGLAVLGRLDLSEGWGRISQRYFASSTTSASGAPQSAQATIGTSDVVPIPKASLGLSWQPAAFPGASLFVGAQIDYFWNTGRTGNFTTFGYFFDSGVVLQAAFNF
jgi:hypothetical protein